MNHSLTQSFERINISVFMSEEMQTRSLDSAPKEAPGVLCSRGALFGLIVNNYSQNIDILSYFIVCFKGGK